MDKSNAGTSGRVNCEWRVGATEADRLAAWDQYMKDNPTILASYRKSRGEWPMKPGVVPPCPTCKRHECKDDSCGWIGYRRAGEDDVACPHCEGPCHALQTEHKAGACRYPEPRKRTGNYARGPRSRRSVVREGDTEEVNDAC